MKRADSPDGRLDDCLQLVDETIGNVREISQLLHPTLLDDFGLDASLHWLAERFTQRTGIEVDYVSNFSGRLPEETETHLFRIAQEALTNIARHSSASRARIEVAADNGNVRLSIEDNGTGLTERDSSSAGGMGMIGMRARARSAGGEIKLRSTAGSGVLVEVSVPVRGVKHEQQEDPSPAR